MADTPSDSSTRPSLLVRLRDVTDTESWQTFVQTYAPAVYRYCRKQGLQDADAADVAQEVLVQVVRSMRTFEYQPQRGRFRDWMGTVARHQVARFLERQSRAARPAGEGAAEVLLHTLAAEPDSAWTDEFNEQLLRVALERIRPHFEAPTWRAFECVWLENRTAPEAAREAGVPIDAVYASKSRVLKRLREEILLLAEDVPHCVP